ncbi:MAG: HEPN domain-containing protein [Deltaproteobacteria bacterium]|nr:HEPN domain-containing protein [Deltaproteobacteria bacterium]
MTPNPELISETKAWFNKAEHDIRMSDLALRDVPPMTDQAVYHAQQAAEKAMKGFLTWNERVFRKTHNLIELGEACARLQPELEPLLRRAAGLSDYAWQYRYPGDLNEPDKDEAENALNLARDTLRTILSLLPQEVQP